MLASSLEVSAAGEILTLGGTGEVGCCSEMLLVGLFFSELHSKHNVGCNFQPVWVAMYHSCIFRILRPSIHASYEGRFYVTSIDVKSCHVRYTIPTYTGGFYVIWAYVKSSHVLYVELLT